MRRIRTTIQALIGATVIAGGMAALTPAVQATTINVACSENALVAAVTLANSTATTDTLLLASGCVYGMTSSHGSAANGQEALPVITTPIEMMGPATITRTAGSFRIAEVSPTGNLTLTTGVALTNGSADGHGGGILNFGAVTSPEAASVATSPRATAVAWPTPIPPTAPRPPRRSPAVRYPTTPQGSTVAASTTAREAR